MNDNGLVAGRMIEGILYVEATDYQLTEAKFAALSLEYEALKTTYSDLKNEFQILTAYNDGD